MGVLDVRRERHHQHSPISTGDKDPHKLLLLQQRHKNKVKQCIKAINSKV